MTSVFIIVDDKPPSKDSLAYNLKETIAKVTSGQYTAELVEGVIISEALGDVRQCVERESGKRHIAGILLDLVEEGNIDAGADLLCQIKADPALSAIDVVVYTSTAVGVKYGELLKAGAKHVVQRDLASNMPAHLQLAKEILAPFGVNITL